MKLFLTDKRVGPILRHDEFNTLDRTSDRAHNGEIMTLLFEDGTIDGEWREPASSDPHSTFARWLRSLCW